MKWYHNTFCANIYIFVQVMIKRSQLTSMLLLTSRMGTTIPWTFMNLDAPRQIQDNHLLHPPHLHATQMVLLESVPQKHLWKKKFLASEWDFCFTKALSCQFFCLWYLYLCIYIALFHRPCRSTPVTKLLHVILQSLSKLMACWGFKMPLEFATAMVIWISHFHGMWLQLIKHSWVWTYMLCISWDSYDKFSSYKAGYLYNCMHEDGIRNRLTDQRFLITFRVKCMALR